MIKKYKILKYCAISIIGSLIGLAPIHINIKKLIKNIQNKNFLIQNKLFL